MITRLTLSTMAVIMMRRSLLWKASQGKTMEKRQIYCYFLLLQWNKVRSIVIFYCYNEQTQIYCYYCYNGTNSNILLFSILTMEQTHLLLYSFVTMEQTQIYCYFLLLQWNKLKYIIIFYCYIGTIVSIRIQLYC